MIVDLQLFGYPQRPHPVMPSFPIMGCDPMIGIWFSVPVTPLFLIVGRSHGGNLAGLLFLSWEANF